MKYRKFASIGKEGVSANVFNNEIVKIFSYVDSRNKYGATIRTKFYVHAERDGGSVKIVDLKIIE